MEQNNFFKNPLAAISAFFERANTRLNRSWNQIIEVPSDPLKKMLNQQRMAIVIYAIATLFFAVIASFHRNFFHLSIFMAVAYLFILIDEIGYMNAIKMGKDERIAYRQRLGKPLRRLTFFGFILVVIAIIITQNVFGLGSAIESSLPWSRTAAEAILSYTNSMVEELVYLFDSVF